MGMYASMLFQQQVINVSLVLKQTSTSFCTQAVLALSKPKQKHVMFWWRPFLSLGRSKIAHF